MASLYYTKYKTTVLYGVCTKPLDSPILTERMKWIDRLIGDGIWKSSGEMSKFLTWWTHDIFNTTVATQ